MRLEAAVLAIALLSAGHAAAEEPDPLAAARLLEEQGDLTAALERYRLALLPAEGRTPSLEAVLDAHEGMARILVRQGIYDRAAGVTRAALARLDEAQGRAPTPALARRGHALAFRLGNYAQAARYCEPLLAETCSAEDRDWALEQTCICYARMGDWAALSAFGERHITALPRGERRAWLQMVTARAHGRQDGDNRANELYRDVITDYPGTPAAELAKSRIASLEIQIPGDPLRRAGSLPEADAPVDVVRLSEALSRMLGAPSRPALTGFRVSSDKGGIRVTLIGPDQASQDLVVSKLADLKRCAPEVMAVYVGLEGRGGPPPETLPREAGHPGYLGILSHALGDDVAAVLHLPPGTAGVLVDHVMPGSPAEQAGLKPGDVLLSVNGQGVDHFTLRARVRAIPAGETARLEILRFSGERATLSVKTGESP